MKLRRSAASFGLLAALFVIGFALMGFEMLGSRYLNPHFGGSINTWAADVEQTFTWESAGKRKVADCFYTAGRGIVTVYGYPAGMTGGAYDLSIDMLKYTATLR